MKAEDCFEMEGTVTITKAPLSNNLVPPDKYERKVYSWLLNNHGSAIAGVTFTIERGVELVRTIPPVILGAFDSLDEESTLGLVSIPAGLNIKAQVTTGTGPVSVILRSFDL